MVEDRPHARSESRCELRQFAFPVPFAVRLNKEDFFSHPRPSPGAAVCKRGSSDALGERGYFRALAGERDF